MKKLFWIALILLAFGLGFYLASGTWLPSLRRYDDDQSAVLLERIEKVAKLVTVDGYFSEVYDYKDYYGYDWSIFRKKALIRVKAHVLAGYDLDQIKIDANSANRTITLSQWPKAEVLRIDHALD